MPTLDGKVAIVTGASRGIGRATAERLARDGAQVVVNYAHSAAEARAVVDGITSAGGLALSLQADVSEPAESRRLVEATVAHCGRLDIFVANAGRAIFKPLAEIDEAEFDRVFSLNARGTFFCLQAAARRLADGGRIVCLSTIGTVLNVAGGTCYFGSKAAVEQFCRVLAREVAPRGITVNLVSPGFTATRMLDELLGADALPPVLDMTPFGRLGEAAEIADVIAFLAGDGARWMTRQNIAVDGGIVAR